MNSVYPKFIIEAGELIIGKCTFHKQLAQNPQNKEAIRGGWWRWDNHEMTEMTLWPGSHDFDDATIEQVVEAIKTKNIERRTEHLLDGLSKLSWAPDVTALSMREQILPEH